MYKKRLRNKKYFTVTHGRKKVAIKKNIFEYNKNGIIFSEKMWNSGNYNHDYAYSFFGKDF